MNHMFCTECGTKIAYSHSKPKFCSSCGSKCGGGSLNRNRETAEFQDRDESLAEDETSINEVPSIGNLQVDIESHGNNVFSLDSLIKEGPKEENVRSKGSRNLEDFINDKRGK